MWIKNFETSGELMRKGLLLLLLAVFAGSADADYLVHPQAAHLETVLTREHGFSPADIDAVRAALRDAQTIPSLIEAEQKAPEKTENWTTYAAKRVDAARIRRGAQFLIDQRVLLARAEREYGVPPAIIAGVLGLETNFGRITGRTRVLDALVTQGFDHPTRSAFFFGELVEYFVFCRDLGYNPTQPTGSYAGAMGWAQFMPSNYRKLAVDFDGDGHRDLWSAADAIGSIGRYFNDYKPALAWQRGQPLAVRARVSGVLDAGLPRNGQNVTHTVAQLAVAGVQSSVRLPQNLRVGLIELPLDPAIGGFEYWIAMPNFYAVMTYNPRVFYAMTVNQLASAMAIEAARLDPRIQ